MTPRPDPVDNRHVIDGFEQYRFSSAEDAREAWALAEQYARSLVSAAGAQEARYRLAAARGQQKVAEVLANG